MINKPIESITADDLEALVANEVAEGRLFEIKRQLPGRSDGDRREFAADVTAFANAQGGDIVFGIEEARGAAAAVCGVTAENREEELRRLESILLNCVDPRIPGLAWRWVERQGADPVLVVRIPASPIAPHSVAISDTVRFHRRHNNRRSEMDVQELREAFTASEALPTRLRALHFDAVDMVARNDLPTGLGREPKAVLSLIPTTYFQEARELEVLPGNALMPVRPQGRVDTVEMVEGVLTDSVPANHDGIRGIAITYRGGRIETAWTIGRMVDELRRDAARLVWPTRFDHGLIDGVLSGAGLLQRLGMTGPWTVHVTLLDIKSYELVLNNQHVSAPAWRDQVILPSLRSDRLDEAALLPLRRAFWLAFGARRPD